MINSNKARRFYDLSIEENFRCAKVSYELGSGLLLRCYLDRIVGLSSYAYLIGAIDINEKTDTLIKTSIMWRDYTSTHEEVKY